MEAVKEYEKPYSARELARIFHWAKSETDIRASFRKRKNPCPCVRSGGKRPIERAYPSVVATYMLYEQGCADYEEVTEAARKCLLGEQAGRGRRFR